MYINLLLEKSIRDEEVGNLVVREARVEDPQAVDDNNKCVLFS